MLRHHLPSTLQADFCNSEVGLSHCVILKCVILTFLIKNDVAWMFRPKHARVHCEIVKIFHGGAGALTRLVESWCAVFHIFGEVLQTDTSLPGSGWSTALEGCIWSILM